MRLAVNQRGERIDDPATVHQTNVLTVVASESYKDFVSSLAEGHQQLTIVASPRCRRGLLHCKVFKTPNRRRSGYASACQAIYKYLAKNDYTDENDHIAQSYLDAKAEEKLAPLPEALAPYAEQVFQIIDSVFSDAQVPDIEDTASSNRIH